MTTTRLDSLWSPLALFRATALATSVLLLPLCARALPMSGLFQWSGDIGYSVEASFTYDDSVPTVIGAPPDSVNVGLIDLYVSVFDPNGALLDAGFNAVPWVTFYPWLAFSFDTATLDLSPGVFLDIGADAGYWLQGDPPSLPSFILWTRTPDENASEIVVDSGGSYRVSIAAVAGPSNPVSDGGSALGMLAGTGGLFVFLSLFGGARRTKFVMESR